MSEPSGTPSLKPISPGPGTAQVLLATVTIVIPVRPPPEGKSVLSLDLAGGISNQEGTIRCVPEFFVHLLPVETSRIGAAQDPALRPCPPRDATPQPYLEMSPQYHSASCRESGLPPLASPRGVGFALGGLGGSAEGQENKHILGINSKLQSAHTVTKPAHAGGA